MEGDLDRIRETRRKGQFETTGRVVQAVDGVREVDKADGIADDWRKAG